MRVLVTGGAGFIGSNFIHYLLSNRRDIRVTNLDKLTYSANLENLSEVASDPRYSFIHADIADPGGVDQAVQQGFDSVVNFAAETHVDRSIEDAAPFLRTNVLGTHTLLEAARRQRAFFVQISTDEVYGSARPNQSFCERSSLDPGNPYSASKAAAEHLVNAYANTYGLRSVILRCTNNYGPFQFPEKLVPLMIANALEYKPLPVYGDGLHQRDWLYVEDFCRAILTALEARKSGETYNVSSGVSIPNLEIVRTILAELHRPESLIQFVPDRLGHDRRYSLDSGKIRAELGWNPKATLDEGLRRTVNWYVRNPDWLAHTRSGEYRHYYDRHYGRRTETLNRITSA